MAINRSKVSKSTIFHQSYPRVLRSEMAGVDGVQSSCIQRNLGGSIADKESFRGISILWNGADCIHLVLMEQLPLTEAVLDSDLIFGLLLTVRPSNHIILQSPALNDSINTYNSSLNKISIEVCRLTR